MLTLLTAALAANPLPRNPEIDPAALPAQEAALGTVLFDVRIPAEVRLDGVVLAQLFTPGRLIVDTALGTREVMVVTNGIPRTLAIDVLGDGRTVVLVGRNGLTSSRMADEAEAEGEVPMQLRVAGDQDVLVTFGDERYHVDAYGSRDLTLPVGTHDMTVRSGDGLVLWARGHVTLERSELTIVQLSEGRLPEISGSGARFHPGR